MLFPMEAVTLQERLSARRDTIGVRVAKAAELVNAMSGQCIVWTNLNAEAEACAKAISGSVEIRGSHTADEKEQAIVDFLEGRTTVLISKGSIFGFGLNLQCCANIVFVGLNDSFEMLYQAIRRCWRFGQTSPVTVHMVTADIEGNVLANIQRKEREATVMAEQMIAHMRERSMEELHGASRRNRTVYAGAQLMRLPAWLTHNAAARMAS
jgi:hypothetical protein